MANIEEIKKMAAEEGVEISEDMLEAIAGGRYSYEEWKAMTDEQREAARLDSVTKRAQHLPCALD